ncbi:MAG: helix-turn-helix domain-containing protein, partial [Rhodospirillales bacterium]
MFFSIYSCLSLTCRFRPTIGNLMLRRQAYRYRIYPTSAQEAFFRQIAGACRFVYN